MRWIYFRNREKSKIWWAANFRSHNRPPISFKISLIAKSYQNIHLVANRLLEGDKLANSFKNSNSSMTVPSYESEGQALLKFYKV